MVDIRRLVKVAFLMVVCALATNTWAGTKDQAPFLEHRADDGWDVTAARGETYEIDFHTKEGTWMSVDISPDGRWIVFDLLGHIYRMPAEGGEAEVLTENSGVALNYHPRISPSGDGVAFVSDRSGQAGLWLMDIDGGNVRPVFNDPISRITSPSWLPDGSAIVAVREFPTYSMHRRSARIWRFPIKEVTAQPEELIGEPAGSQAYWPTVSPDGRYLYFMYSTFAAPLDGMQAQQHIRKLDLATGKTSTVTQNLPDRPYWNSASSELAPEVSPDGRWLAFARRIPGGELEYRGHVFRGRTALWLRDQASGEERILADPITLDMQNAHGMKNLRVLPGYSWAKDSQSLVIWHEGKIRRIWLDGRIRDLPFEARVYRTASERARWSHGYDETQVPVQNVRWPTISVLHSKLVFEAAGEIWTYPLAGSRRSASKLVSWSQESAYSMPEVSPDGDTVVFVSWNDHRLGHVWVCKIDDCNPRRVTNRASKYIYPTWSHDGSAVMVLRSRDTDSQRLAAQAAISFDLVSLSLDKGEFEVVQESVAITPVVRGPDERYFRLEQRGRVNVQEYLKSGKKMPEVASILTSFPTNALEETRSHLSFPSAEFAQLSPDGRHVVYIEDNEAYLAPAIRELASYAVGESNRWDGERQPQPIVKENPEHKVEQISFGGARNVRWVDTETVIYAAGGTVKVFDMKTSSSDEFKPNIILEGHVPPRSKSVALAGGRVITLGDAGVLENANIVVRGSRISCIGQCNLAEVDRVIDVKGKTLVPGFVDVHAHGDYGSIGPLMPQAYPSVALYLAHGVTTTLDPATHADVFSVSEMTASGRMTGTRVFSTGEALMPLAPSTGPQTASDANAIVERLASMGAVSIKVFLQPRRDQRQMLGEAAKKLGLSVTNEGADLYYNIGSMLDGHTGFEHPMHYMALYHDVTEFFARARAVYSPTLVVAGGGVWAEEYHQSRSNLWNNKDMQRFMPWQDLVRRINVFERPISEYTFPFLAEGVADIKRAGGVAAIGGHGEQWGLDSHWEMWIYGEALSPLEVLEMSSLGGAYMIGLDRELGSLEVGKIADIVVLNTNPLDDLQNTADIENVMKGGVLYEADSLDQVWPDERAFMSPAWVRKDIFKTDRKIIN